MEREREGGAGWRHKRRVQHTGLLRLVSVATSNPHVGDVISSLTWKTQARGVGTYTVRIHRTE